MSKLVNDFYKVIECVINKIINNEEINNLLFKCKYNIFYQKTKEFVFNENKQIPIIFCLGGIGYQIYCEIISKYYQNIKLLTKTNDYDFSFCLINNIPENIVKIKNIVNDTIIECIKNYKFDYEDENKRKFKINKENFTVEIEEKKDRLQIKINCSYGIRKFHILELCFWYNGKISDNFTVNDFKKEKIFIYVDNIGYHYYLLPLEKLIKTTYYAILDNYERNNFEKCNKYLDRIRYIKLTNDEYNKSNKKIELLNFIYRKYFDDIYKKYKIMYDYPFINSKILVNEKNFKIVKCVYRELRTNMHKIYIGNIQKYIKKCENNKNILKFNEITEEDTDKDLIYKE